MRRFHSTWAICAALVLIAHVPVRAITITGPDSHIPSLGVPTEPDVVTLNPDPVVPVSPASLAMRQRLAAEYGGAEGFNFMFPATPLTGTFHITRYEAVSLGAHNGGGLLEASYTRGPGDPPLEDLEWIQMVDTTSPLGGATSPYIDPRPNDDPPPPATQLPFYYTQAESSGTFNGVQTKDFQANTFYYLDRSTRTCPAHPSVTTWRGELLLANYNRAARIVDVYDGVQWGWDFFCPSFAIPPFSLSSPTLPPNQGDYAATGDDTRVVYSAAALGTAVLSDFREHSFANIDVNTVGGDEVYRFDAHLETKLDLGPELGEYLLDMQGPVVMKAAGKAGHTTGNFELEVLGMNFFCRVETPLGTMNVVLRESPSLQSKGHADISGSFNYDAYDGPEPATAPYYIESFFDVFTELSINGGPFAPSLSGPVRMQLVPEPSGAILLGSALGGLLLFVRRGAASFFSARRPMD